MRTNKKVLFYLLLLWCTFPALGQSNRQAVKEKEKTFRLGGNLPQLGTDDTLVLKVWQHLFYYGVLSSPENTQKIVANRGRFQFSLSAPQSPFYFSLYQLKKDNGDIIQLDILSYYIGEKGDDIIVSERDGKLRFSGAGASKINVQYAAKKLDTVLRQESAKKVGYSDNLTDDTLLNRLMNFSITLLKQKLRLLNKNKTILSKEVLDLVKADVIAKNLEGRIFTLQNGLFGEKTKLEKYLRYCNQFVHPLLNEPIPAVTKARSRLYVPILLEHELLEARLKGQVTKGPEFYKSLTKRIDENLLDRFRTELVLRYYPKFSQAEDYMKYALQEVTAPYCKEVLLNLFSRSQKGKTIYNYPFKDSASKTIYLSDLKGKFVFVDVWYVGCGGCHSFYQNSLKLVEEHFKDEPDIVFVSICANENRGKWLKAVNSGSYTSVSMINLTAGGFESPFLKYYNVHTYPFQILLDREGKICRIDDLQKSPEELIEILNSYLQP